ncbi:HD domain-containing protein [Spirosoma aerophilum]
MLTLEQHLNNTSINNDFELLKSIWILNKKYLKNAQNAIIFNFPHYSLHESSHSNTIIRNIESFLGEERISQLTPTDTWLILMAAHTHDLGMVIFNNVLEKKWAGDEFQKYLKFLSNKSSDKDLRESAQLLSKLNDVENHIPKDNLTIALQIRKAVILVTADFFRVNHHVRSKEIILGEDIEFNKYLNGFSLTGIPNRFIVVLAEIGFGHGVNFYEVFDRLEFIADGFGGDKMHPRFIAYLLRLGDLLDVDDKRFSIFNEKVLADSLPNTSKLHKEKHASIKHLLIAPTSIEVTVDCMSDEVYRIARGWFDWLQDEVKDQSKEWANIAPKNLSGLPPTISRDGIKILYKSSEPKIGLMNLRFEISNKKVFEMFEGSAIYEYTGLVFIREIVQNAIDASKIQLWKLVENGYYDNLIRRDLKLSWDLLHDDLINNIKFYFDLPLEIWSNFLIDLNFYWDGESLRITIQDNGTGISEEDLIRMTKKVGESRSSDENFQKLKKQMPFWLKPTGAFGIGLQSLFLVSNTFIIQTKSEYEEGKEIQFFSAKNGEYCRITPTKIEMRRGTKIIININKDDFDNIFENKFPVQIINSYDWFDDDYKNVHIHRLIAYVLEEFQYIDLLNIYVNNKQIKKSTFLEEDYLEIQSSIICKREKDISAYLYKRNNNRQYNHFRLFEDLGIGSDFSIFFYNSLIQDGQNRRHSSGLINKQLVRDIPLEESPPSYYKTSYFKYIWNFESPESDKILNISRSKFIKKTKKKFDNIFLEKVLPKSLELIVKLFEENILPGEENTAIEYFHVHLTASMNKVTINQPEIFYKDFKLPNSFATKHDLSEVKYIDFFKANRLLSISADYRDPILNIVGAKHDTYKEITITNNYDIDLILWDFEYFSPYLKVLGFKKVEYYIYDSDKQSVSISIFEKSAAYVPLKCNEASIKQLLTNSIYSSEAHKRRDAIPPLEKYWKQLSVNEWFDGFLFHDNFTDNLIISPFRNSQELKSILSQIDSSGTFDTNDLLRDKYLSSLIPNSLLEYVISKSPFTDVKRNPESVMESYYSLILDIISANRSKNLQ